MIAGNLEEGMEKEHTVVDPQLFKTARCRVTYGPVQANEGDS